MESLGAGVGGFELGDQVAGFTNERGSHADYVVAEAANLAHRPDSVSVDVAGAIFVAGTTAYAAVRAVAAGPDDVVVVSGAAGGVGSIAVQLAAAAGARVIGIAGPGNHDWLRAHGAVPVAYGDGVADRIRAAAGRTPDAFIDTYGSGYVRIALDLGVRPERVDTVADYAAVEKYGVKSEGNAAAATAGVVGELLDLVAKGELEVPIARTYPLENVRDAFRDLENRHTRGKIVLRP